MNKSELEMHLRELSKLVGDAKWFVAHGERVDGLSTIDDGQQHGMFPITGEAHEIEFAAACVDYVRSYVLKGEQV